MKFLIKDFIDYSQCVAHMSQRTIILRWLLSFFIGVAMSILLIIDIINVQWFAIIIAIYGVSMIAYTTHGKLNSKTYIVMYIWYACLYLFIGSYIVPFIF